MSELIQFVESKCDEIIEGKKFNLGSLEYNDNWDLNNPSVEQLVENIISYSLLRDEYRAYVKCKAANNT